MGRFAPETRGVSLTMRTFEELVASDDPVWPAIQEAIAAAVHPVTIVPGVQSVREATLTQLQVSTRSGLGALALQTGGLLVDHGWLRLLGGGEPPLNLAVANRLEVPPDGPPGALLVAFDILGGRDAINGGVLPGSAARCVTSPRMCWLGGRCRWATWIS